MELRGPRADFSENRATKKTHDSQGEDQHSCKRTNLLGKSGEPPGTRTQNPQIKRMP